MNLRETVFIIFIIRKACYINTILVQLREKFVGARFEKEGLELFFFFTKKKKKKKKLELGHCSEGLPLFA
jgi:hypothetical protein